MKNIIIIFQTEDFSVNYYKITRKIHFFDRLTRLIYQKKHHIDELLIKKKFFFSDEQFIYMSRLAILMVDLMNQPIKSPYIFDLMG